MPVAIVGYSFHTTRDSERAFDCASVSDGENSHTGNNMSSFPRRPQCRASTFSAPPSNSLGLRPAAYSSQIVFLMSINQRLSTSYLCPHHMHYSKVALCSVQKRELYLSTVGLLNPYYCAPAVDGLRYCMGYGVSQTYELWSRNPRPPTS
jgi:hypothetical protein